MTRDSRRYIKEGFSGTLDITSKIHDTHTHAHLVLTISTMLVSVCLCKLIPFLANWDYHCKEESTLSRKLSHPPNIKYPPLWEYSQRISLEFWEILLYYPPVITWYSNQTCQGKIISLPSYFGHFPASHVSLPKGSLLWDCLKPIMISQ